MKKLILVSVLLVSTSGIQAQQTVLSAKSLGRGGDQLGIGTEAFFSNPAELISLKNMEAEVIFHWLPILPSVRYVSGGCYGDPQGPLLFLSYINNKKSVISKNACHHLYADESICVSVKYDHPLHFLRPPRISERTSSKSMSQFLTWEHKIWGQWSYMINVT